MSGNSYSKQSGQVLLIIVMLLATAVTIVMAAAFKSTTDTQLTKLEEENKKALSAAEAGIEAAIRDATPGTPIDISQLPGLGGFSGQATVQTSQDRQFETPLIARDKQYTFYLQPYDSVTKQITGTGYSGQIRIQLANLNPNTYCNAAETRFALEILLINKDNGEIERRLIDGCNLIDNSDDTLDFNISFSPTITSGAHLMIMRVLSPSSNLSGVKLLVVNPLGGQWPAQGNIIESQAKSATGVSKKVQLFQSYPQIPAEFFTTSFRLPSGD